MADCSCVYRLATIAPGTIILSGCETLVYSSLYVSGSTADAIERHTLPILDDIDRVEIQKEPWSPTADLMASSLTNSQDIARLVRIVNNNRSSWKNLRLDVTPPVPNRHPAPNQEVSVSIHFWKNGMTILKVHANKRILTTQVGSQTIYREISETDAGEIGSVIETSSYTTLARPVNPYRYQLRNEPQPPR